MAAPSPSIGSIAAPRAATRAGLARAALVVTSLVIFCVLPGEARAQTPFTCKEGVTRALKIGEVIDCTLEVAGDEDGFTFHGSAGTEIRLITLGTGGSVDIHVEVRDPDGILLHDGDCDTGCEPLDFNLLPSATLPKTGTYDVQVSDFGLDDSGSYEVIVGCVSVSCDQDLDGLIDAVDNCRDAANPAQVDSDLDGFGNACDADYDQSDYVAIGDFGLFLQRFGCAAGDGCYDGIFDHDSDGVVGIADFGFFLPLFGRPPGPAVPSLAYQEQDGEALERRTDMDLFAFEGAAGTEIRLIAASIAPVDVRVEIRGPNGDLLHDGDCAAGCETSDFNVLPSATLPLPGTYQVLASEFGLSDSGGYSVIAGCLFGACPGAPAPTPLIFGVTLIDDLGFRVDLDRVSFAGAQGCEISLTSVGISLGVSTRIEIRAPSGTLLHDGSCSAGCEASSFNVQPSATLPESGTYTATISEEGHDDGGAYSVLVQDLGCGGP